MNYVLENSELKVEISDAGAELQSVKGKKSGFEYLWQGNPDFWKSRSTVLFPICGRLCDGKYTYKGNTYEMILHGFAKKSLFKVCELKENQITFELTSNEDTLKIYPFEFIFRVCYSLEGASVKVILNVINKNDGPLHFSCGGHPGFNVPLMGKGKFTDCYLEFACEKPVERIIMAPSCLYSGKNELFPLEGGKILRLKHELFDDDAIFLTKMCHEVSLKSTKCKNSLTVSFGDMTYLGFWHKPKTEAPFVCIEPWHGLPATDGVIDDFETKNGFVHLSKGEEYSTWFEISVNE